MFERTAQGLTVNALLLRLSLLGCLLLSGVQAHAIDLFRNYQPEVVISDPYIELRTGPGRGFPIFYVAGQGDAVTVLKRKTDWFKVRVTEPRVTTGWVHLEEMRHTLDLSGREIDFGELGLEQFSNRRVEAGFNGGDFGGASSLTGYVG